MRRGFTCKEWMVVLSIVRFGNVVGFYPRSIFCRQPGGVEERYIYHWLAGAVTGIGYIKRMHGAIVTDSVGKLD